MNEQTERQQALKWWNEMSFEEQFYKTIAANSLLIGDNTRNPDSLTGREIKLIYNFNKLTNKNK